MGGGGVHHNERRALGLGLAWWRAWPWPGGGAPARGTRGGVAVGYVRVLPSALSSSHRRTRAAGSGFL